MLIYVKVIKIHLGHFKFLCNPVRMLNMGVDIFFIISFVKIWNIKRIQCIEKIFRSWFLF